MPRFAATLLAGLLMLSSTMSPGLAQEAATPAAGATSDLAMMTLTPSDLAALGQADYGLANQSSLRDAKTDALVQADGDVVAERTRRREGVRGRAGRRARRGGCGTAPRQGRGDGGAGL